MKQTNDRIEHVGPNSPLHKSRAKRQQLQFERHQRCCSAAQSPVRTQRLAVKPMGLAETCMQLSEGVSGAEGPRQTSKARWEDFRST